MKPLCRARKLPQAGMICQPGIHPPCRSRWSSPHKDMLLAGHSPTGQGGETLHCPATLGSSVAALLCPAPCWHWPAPATAKTPPTEVEPRLTAAEQPWRAAQPWAVGKSWQTEAIQGLPASQLPTMPREIAEQITKSSHVE